MAIRAVIGATALALLAGCGCNCCGSGGGGTTEPPERGTLDEDFQELRDDFGTLSSDLGGLAPTASVPSRGQATYKGVAEMRLGDGDALLYGEARLSVDFDDEELSGRFDDFVGRVGSGPVQAWDGRLDIDETDDPWEAVAEGTLRAGPSTIAVDVPLEGRFVGVDGAGIGVESRGGNGRLNGRNVPVGIDAWGEPVWRSDD